LNYFQPILGRRLRRGLQVAAALAAVVGGRVSRSWGESLPASPDGIVPYLAMAWTAPSAPLAHVVGVVRFQSSSDPEKIARALKVLPEGERFLLRWESNDNQFWGNPADQLIGGHSQATRPGKPESFQGPWIDHGAAAEAVFETRFAAALRQRGASPDYLVLDTEMGISTWELTAPQLRAIMADRRWPAVAKRFGVSGTAGLVGAGNNPNAQAFNLAMQVTSAGYFRAGYFELWQAAFPRVCCSDFGDGVLNAVQAVQAVDDGGGIQPMALPMHGNVQSPCCYAWVHKIGRPPSNQGADFSNPLPALCWIVSMTRAYAQSPQPIVPWVAAKSWTDGSVPIANTPYQDELLWHVCLSAGCTDVLFFNPDSPAADNAAMDADLAALQQQAGDSPTLVPLTRAAVAYTSPVLVSGARCANGRRLYRVTVGAGPTTAPAALTLVLPGESATTTLHVRPGEVGLWVVR
jgi:hypothetical protein